MRPQRSPAPSLSPLASCVVAPRQLVRELLPQRHGVGVELERVRVGQPRHTGRPAESESPPYSHGEHAVFAAFAER